MEDYQLGVLLKGRGKPLAKKDDYEVYQEGSDMSVYGVWEEDGVKYGQHRGYLANLENFESVIGELEYEAKVMLQEFREEFGL